MKMSEYLQKKRILLIISTILIIAFVVISIIIYNKKNKESNNIQEQDLSITYNISKSDVAPRDEASAPLSTINIKNNKSYQQKYQLIVKPDDKSTLGLDKIYISIDGNNKLLSDCIDGIVYQGTIDANKEIVLSFKTWINILDDSDQDKVVSLKYEIKKQD
jgi:preprotein translocase subunit SecG